MTSNQLETWRRKLGLNQTQAAKALGVPYSTYRQWEDGRIKPHKLLTLACAYLDSNRSGSLKAA